MRMHNPKLVSRHVRVAADLDQLQEAGVISDWWVYSPADGGRRWVVGIPGGGRTFSTYEVEIWMHGANAALRLSHVH